MDLITNGSDNRKNYLYQQSLKQNFEQKLNGLFSLVFECTGSPESTANPCPR